MTQIGRKCSRFGWIWEFNYEMTSRHMISKFNLSQQAPSSGVSRMSHTLTTGSFPAPPIASPPAPPPVGSPPIARAPKSARRKHSKVVKSPTISGQESDEEHLSVRPRKKVRGKCRMIKSQKIVLANGNIIKINYDPRFRGAEKSQTHSLLVHDIGAIVRTHCPMNVPSFDDLSTTEKCDLRDFLTVCFDIDYDDEQTTHYIDSIFRQRFSDWKYDCHQYFKEFDKEEEAQASPPFEFIQAERESHWRKLCDHFMTPKFQKKSAANKGNRGKKLLNHHGGAKPFVYQIQDLMENGSKFPAVDNFKKVYVTPDNPAATPLYEKMQKKINDFTKDYESQFAPDTPLDEIPLPGPEIGVKILTETLEELGPNVGSYVRGMGRGMVHDVKRRLPPSTSQASINKVKDLEEKLGQSQEEVKQLKEKMTSQKEEMAFQTSMFSKLLDVLKANGIQSLDSIVAQSTSTNQV